MKTTTKYVGLDVHKDTTVVAAADGGLAAEVRLYGEIAFGLGALKKFLRSGADQLRALPPAAH